MATTGEARETVLRYIEAVWNRGDLEALDELTTGDFAYTLGDQPALDRQGFRRFLDVTRRAFPDWWVEPVDVVAEPGAVAVRWRGKVSHLGAFHGIPPTGRRIAVSGINADRLEGGKIAAEREQADSLGMLRQMGVLPT